jgi:hypothetical protein
MYQVDKEGATQYLEGSNGLEDMDHDLLPLLQEFPR